MSMTRVKDGKIIILTADEESAVMAKRAIAIAAMPMDKWLDNMSDSDSNMPRYMEDLITNNASLVIPAVMRERYDVKIKIRGERP